ncbi:MAG TPA: hypothetical protein DDZ40_01275 [Deltaproteobacteria bacterium]|nr:hypothetical protein [Deltaproteobacteria bacterium]
MKGSIAIAGLDVHGNSAEVALAETGRTMEARHYGRFPACAGLMSCELRRLVLKCGIYPS